MRRWQALATGWIMAGALAAASAQSSGAETADAVARIGGGQTVKISAAPDAGVILLEFALPGEKKQSFPNLGTELVSFSGKPDDKALIALDIDGDGIDEIFLRALVPPQTGAMVVFRWNATLGEYEPVEFTNDRDQKTKFLVVDPVLPVSIEPAGMIEAQFVSTRADGRKSHYIARYRWSGKGYRQSADN